MVLTRLTVLRPLESDNTCLVITVKLQGYKRILRCSDLVVSAVNGIIDIDLDISFTLQYPHFVKRKHNCVQVLLQRRKRYKNRPIPGGYKTIAVGVINLTEVLQSSIDRELCLYESEAKLDESATERTLANPQQQSCVVAKLYFRSCGTQPLEHPAETGGTGSGVPRRKAILKQQLLEQEFTDEEADEDSTNEELGGSDSDAAVAVLDEQHGHSKERRTEALRRVKGGFNKLLLPASANKQRNVKQRFAALLKKFKLNAEVLDNPESIAESQATSRELEALFEELDNLSESGGELDNVSQGTIHSEPKPRLPIFFHQTQAGSREALTRADLEKHAAACLSDESRDSCCTDDNNSGDNSPLQRLKRFHLNSSQEAPPTGTGAAHALQSHMLREKLHPIHSAPCSTAASGGDPTHVTAGQSALSTPPLSSAHSTAALKREFLSQPQQPSSVATVGGSAAGTAQQVVTTSMHDRSSMSLGVQPVGDNCKAAAAGKGLPPLRHRMVAEQLAVLGNETLPDYIWLVSAHDVHCQELVDRLARDSCVLVGSGSSDVRSILICILSKIQKFCNSSASAPKLSTICLLGGDRFVSYAIRAYTELFAHKSNEWQFYIRFCIVTHGGSMLFNRVLSQVDVSFAGAVFTDCLWREWWERVHIADNEQVDIVGRVRKYVQSCKSLLPLPIAEAMLQLRDKSDTDEHRSQVFVPFISDVRFGGGQPSEAAGQHWAECDSPSQLLAPALPAITATASSVAGGEHSLAGSSSGQSQRQSQQVAALTLAPTSYNHHQESAADSSLTHHHVAGSPPASPHIMAHSRTIGSFSPSNLRSLKDAISPSADLSTSCAAQELTVEYWTAVQQWAVGQCIGLNPTAPGSTLTSTAVAAGAGGSGAGVLQRDNGGGGGGAGGKQPAGQPGDTAATTQAQLVSKRQDSFSAASPVKCSVKCLFRWLCVSRLPPCAGNTSSAVWMANAADAPNCLCLSFVKEKKKEKMFLRMKTQRRTEEGDQQRQQQVEAVSRLICSSKHSTIRVAIDGVEYGAVKFFQVSPQWQTHVKQFPLAVCLQTE